uniref:START domain-containing protein n=1 Tax=Caenorhabditis japonica TaxID=281687 RepID=A0A8R1HJU1_CAEJA
MFWRWDGSNDDGDVVFATSHGRMVTISTKLRMPPEDVIKEAWDGVQTMSQWYQNINFASRIAAPTPNFDIGTYGNNV